MIREMKKLMLIFLLTCCFGLSACGQKETIEPSSEGTPAPLQWEDVYNPADGTIDQDKYNEYMGISVPEQAASEEVPENVVLLGATSADYQYISEQVNTFNQVQNDYKVKVQRYESTDAMFLDLVRGQGCDLLALSPTDLTILADKGGLENLAPYLDKSEKVSREDLFDAVVEAGTAGGDTARFYCRSDPGGERQHERRRLDHRGISGTGGQISGCTSIYQCTSGWILYMADV